MPKLSTTLTVSEAAKALGMTHQQVLNRVKRGSLKGKKKGWFWLIPRSSVQAALLKSKKSK